MSESGAVQILDERRRQRDKEGYSNIDDRRWVSGELASAALCYIYTLFLPNDHILSFYWPWAKEYWKPKDRVRNLVRAGALIAAEIDRLQALDKEYWKPKDRVRNLVRAGALINRAFKGFAALPDPNTREWWEVLNVPRMADDATIRMAYLRLARQYHPDSGENGGDAVMFDQVQKAYDLAIGKRGA